MIMRKFVFTISLSFVCFMFAACGGAAGEPANTRSNANVNANTQNITNTAVNVGSNADVQNVNAPQAGIPAEPAANMRTLDPETAAAEMQATPETVKEEDMTPLQRARKERLDQLRKMDKGDPNAPIQSTPVPAPDNSEYSASLTKDMVETRTFKVHPVIAKAVRTTTPKTSTLRIYFRDGSIKDLPGSSVKDLAKAPAEELIRAAQ